MSLSFDAEGVEVTANYSKSVRVTVDVSDDSVVLEEVGIMTAIGHYGADDLLDAIGKQAAIDYHEIKEAE